MKTRKQRNRYKLRSLNPTAYRLVVFRSINHIYAEVLDADNKHVCASNSASVKNADVFKSSRMQKAEWVGNDVAQKALKLIGDNKIYFDRGDYLYHGVVKCVAEAARKAGLEF